MKKSYLLIAIMTFILMLLIVPMAQAATYLRYGSNSPDVIIMQAELNQLGYNVGTLDGIFGSKTLGEVKAFQTANGLTCDGIVGPLTNQALINAVRQKKSQDIVSKAQALTGVPYLWGGTTPAGFDCSGFTQYVFKANGITLPRTSTQQYAVGTPVKFNSLQVGDLVFFNFISNALVSHVGIYIGNNQFISATTQRGVIAYSFTPYWNSAYVGARRIY